VMVSSATVRFRQAESRRYDPQIIARLNSGTLQKGHADPGITLQRHVEAVPVGCKRTSYGS